MTLLEDVAAEAPRMARGRLAVTVSMLAGLVLLAAGLSAWGWVGTHPEPARGSAEMLPEPPMRLATDGIEETRYVLDGNGGPGELRFSLRNAGRVPFTVLGLAPAPGGGEDQLWRGIAMKKVSDASWFRWDQAGPGEVALEPGQQVAVLLRVEPSACLPWQAGTGAEVETVDLRIRQLGLTTTQPFAFRLPVYVQFTKDRPATRSC